MFSLEQEWFLRAPALAAQACLDTVRKKVGHSLLQFDFVIYIIVLCLIIFWSSYRQIAHIAKRPPWAKLKLREPWKCTANEHLFISNPGLSEHYLTLWSHVKRWCALDIWEDESEGYLRRSWAPHLQGMWHRTPEWKRRHEYFYSCNMIDRYILCILDHLCNANTVRVINDGRKVSDLDHLMVENSDFKGILMDATAGHKGHLHFYLKTSFRQTCWTRCLDICCVC